MGKLVCWPLLIGVYLGIVFNSLAETDHVYKYKVGKKIEFEEDFFTSYTIVGPLGFGSYGEVYKVGAS